MCRLDVEVMETLSDHDFEFCQSQIPPFALTARPSPSVNAHGIGRTAHTHHGCAATEHTKFSDTASVLSEEAIWIERLGIIPQVCVDGGEASIARTLFVRQNPRYDP